MRALVWRGGTQLTVEALKPPRGGDGWVRVAPSHVGLCGTDLHICAGTHPRARPGLVIGHEFVGRLLEEVGQLRPGAPVFVNPLLPCGACPTCRAGLTHACDQLQLIGIDLPGGAAEQVLVPRASIVELPAELELGTAALIEPLAVAVRAVRRGGVGLGDDVHVLGAGPIGLLVASCARAAGAARVTLTEPAPSRGEAVRRLGFELLGEAGEERRADIVFDSTGHPAAARRLARWAATGGRLVVVGVYEGEAGVDLRRITFGELTMIGSRVYTPPEVAAAIELLASGRIRPDLLVSAVVGLEQAPAALARMRRGEELKVLVAL